MSKRLLTIAIECGDTTCYDYTEKRMCPEVLTCRFGTEWLCGVFHRVVLRDVEDRLQRCKECLDAEEKV